MTPSSDRSVTKGAAQAPPDIERLCAIVRAAEFPAGGRMLLRALCHRHRHQPPTMPAENVFGLAEAVIRLGVSVDSASSEAIEVCTTFNADIPVIQVDKLLRGTLACDMPADVRSALRTLAGHANTNGREAWPDRETLAGETGVSVKRIDIILADLTARKWITKGPPRKRAQGGKGPCTITLHPERGIWWPAESRSQRARQPPPLIVKF